MNEAAGFEVVTLGTGNSFGTDRYCTSFVLRAGGQTILVDCPEPFFRMCKEASERSGRAIDPNEIDHVILTHLHGDHCNGLEGWGFWRKFVEAEHGLPTIHTSNAVAALLWQRLSASMAEATVPPGAPVTTYGMEDYFHVEAREPGEPFEIGGVEIETRATQHSVPCFGFRASYGGRRFGYSCDTIYDPELIVFLEDSDLIFHECDDGLIHSPLAELESLPEATRKKMRLVHLKDGFEGSTKIESAEEGRVYKV